MGMQFTRETTYSFTCDNCGIVQCIRKDDKTLEENVVDVNAAKKLMRLNGWSLGKRKVLCSKCSNRMS